MPARIMQESRAAAGTERWGGVLVLRGNLQRRWCFTRPPVQVCAALVHTNISDEMKAEFCCLRLHAAVSCLVSFIIFCFLL